jgi:two-component system, NtrC family, response regulator AtoC
MSRERLLRILLADDEEIVHQTLGDYLRESGHEVASVRDGLAGCQALEAHEYDLALVDVRMPGMDGLALLTRAEQLRPDLPVVIVTGQADLKLTVQALRLGAADFLTKPVKLVELDAVLEKVLRLRGLRRDKRRLHGAIRGLQARAEAGSAGTGLVGASPATHQLRQQIREAVEAGCETILITGETGTGKEVTAREIHFCAHAPDVPFIAVSCPALPESLVESELFGHVKGSFTGASQDRIGYFELADGSTIFLDEIGDLPASVQAKILRVLETRSLRRVGASEEITVQVRVIAATNAPLEEHVQSGSFRRDLFYRLNVYRIHLLPLRERREDILPLAEHFLTLYAAPRRLQFGGFSAGARDKLLSYAFPGNVRELRYLVERAAILGRSGQIQPEHLTLPSAAPAALLPCADEDPERAPLLRSLDEAHWNLREAAKRLGVPYSTLRYKMQKLGIKK